MRSIPTVVYALGFVSLLSDFSSEIIYPLIPIFLSQVLGATPIALGVIEGVAETTSSFLKIFSGKISDKFTARKPFLLIGYSIAGFARPFIAFATSWNLILLLRFIDRIGKGIRSSPRDALISEVTAEQIRGKAYGIQRMMDNAGAVLGPMVASILLGIFVLPIKTVILCAFVPAILTIFVLIFMVTEPQSVQKQKSKNNKMVLNLKEDWKLFPLKFKVFLLALLIFTLGNSTDAFLILKLSQAGLSASTVTTLWGAHNFLKMILAYIGGVYSDKIGHKNMLQIAWIIYAFIYFMFAFFGNTTLLIITFLLYSLYFGFSEPSERALISLLAPSNLKGTAFGYFHFIIGISALPASVIFGFMWFKFGAMYAFILGALLAFIASIILLVCNIDTQKQ